MKKILLIFAILASLLIPQLVSAEPLPFSIEPGKVIGYNIRAGSKFTFPITVYNNSEEVKTFHVKTRLPDILSEGYEASDGKWVSIPESIEVNPNSTETIYVQVTAPETSLETWIGVTEDVKSGLRYELITKVMVDVSNFGISSLGIVRYSQPGEEKRILSYEYPVILCSVLSVILIALAVTVILVMRRKRGKQRI